jgi:hypothetical protein
MKAANGRPRMTTVMDQLISIASIGITLLDNGINSNDNEGGNLPNANRTEWYNVLM